MIATFDLLLYALLINHISSGITSAEELPRFPHFKTSLHEYMMLLKEGGDMSQRPHQGEMFHWFGNLNKNGGRGGKLQL